MHFYSTPNVFTFLKKACFRQNKIPNRFAVKEYILIVLILAPFMSSQLRFSNEVILKITETKMKRLSLLCCQNSFKFSNMRTVLLAVSPDSIILIFWMTKKQKMKEVITNGQNYWFLEVARLWRVTKNKCGKITVNKALHKAYAF